jgi:hypothetical protein
MREPGTGDVESTRTRLPEAGLIERQAIGRKGPSTLAAIIRLEDGRGLHGSSLSIDTLLSLVADEVSGEYEDLRIWLVDKARRPSPFQDMDLGRLDPSRRAEFYAAASRAYSARLREDPTLAERSHGIQRLGSLLEMRASIERGEPPLALSDFDFVLESTGDEDLSEIWGL